MTDRLDPQTLREIAQRIRETWQNNTTSADGLHLALGFASGLDGLAAEAASRPPTLSELVRVCEVSPLAPMTTTSDDDGAWVFCWGGDAFESALIGAFVTFTVEPSGSAFARLGFNPETYATVEALRRALWMVHEGITEQDIAETMLPPERP